MKIKFEQNAARKGLLLFAALSLFVGGMFWLWNPLPDVRPRAGRAVNIVSGKAVGSAQQGDAGKAGIVNANIFSATRTPPSLRYDPADDGLGDVVEALPSMNTVEVLPPPELFGTVVGPGGAMALMRSDSAGSGRLYREGDRIGSYRLLKVKANSVTVSGPSGRMEIQVQRSPTGAP